MAGGIVQLVACGIENVYLSGDPQITFFKVLYRRHTNFAIESIIQNFTSVANFGETVSCTLGRVGDLVGKIFLHIDIPPIPEFRNIDGSESKFAWVKYLGFALIQEIRIEIGGKIIDKHYGEWLYIWSQVSNRHDIALSKMVGNVPIMYTFTNSKPGYKLIIPLSFWFCKSNGLSIPIIALASSDVKITVTFRKADECYRIGPTHCIDIVEDVVPFEFGDYIKQTINGDSIYGYVIDYDYINKKLYYIKIFSPTANRKSFVAYQSNQDLPTTILDDPNYSNNIQYRITDYQNRFFCTPKPNTFEFTLTKMNFPKLSLGNTFLYVDYVYLDKDERNKFVYANHEYLIEQVQFNQAIGLTSPNCRVKLALNHPCKAFYWVAQLDSIVGPNTINDFFNYTSFTDNNGLIDKSELVLDGRSRFNELNSAYFNYVQPYQHHYRGPDTGINVYSISINPEDIQPSSTLNASKYEDINLYVKLSKNINPQNTAKIRVYTINYNILRVCFNMGGLVFS